MQSDTSKTPAPPADDEVVKAVVIPPCEGRICSIETFVDAAGFVGLVRVRTDAGGEGWGQVAPYHADITATVLHRQVAGLFLGRRPDELPERCGAVLRVNYKWPWSYVCRALAGIDLAVWDLVGRAHGKPVAELLGGTLAPRRAYGSSMRRDLTAAEEAERLARIRDRTGLDAFKIRVGDACGRDVDAAPGRTEAVIAACRAGLGDGVALMADANSGYAPARAIEVGKLLQDHDYAHFEEPCPWWELEQTAEVAAALDIDVAGGEQDNDLAQFRRMMRMKAVDVVQPDVCYAGGFSRCLAIARAAAAAGIPVLPHSANRSLLLDASVHLASVIQTPGDYVEYSVEDDPPFEAFRDRGPTVADGRIRAPEGPGWGLRVRPGWLKRATRTERVAASW